MEQINTLLNLPEHATASDRVCAVYELMQEYDNIQAAQASAEHELMALREATSHIFAESICAARGITDASAQEDIRAAWCADPYAALNAFAGENITAANPYGCNQYGHEWRGKHGEGWQPRGDKQSDNKKREETPEERTKRIVVDSIKDANSTLEELNKKLGKPPYDISDPRARAKINLEHELTRTKERDTEEAAERLKQTTERAKKALAKGKEDKQKGKNLADALKKLSPRMDKNGQGLMPFAENENKSDAEIDNFEKASTDKKREILSGWKQKVRDARRRKDGTEKKEEENLFNKIRKLGKKRGWSKEKLDSTLKGLELDLKSDYDTFLI